MLVAAAAAFFGLNGTVSKLLIRGGFEPIQLTTFRATGAFLGLLVLVLATRRTRAMAATAREVPRLVVYGLLGIFSVPLLYFVAISRLPVGIGLLFEFTAPAFVALWVRFGERRQVRRRLWFGLALCLVGLVSVAQLWAGELRLDGLGVLAGTVSAILLAAWYVLGATFVAGTTAVGSSDHAPAQAKPRRDPLTLTCWGFGAAAVAGSVLRPWWNFDGSLLTGRSDGVSMGLLAAYLIVFGTIVPYLLITFAMKHLPPTSIGIIGMVEIILASSFAWLLLDEVLVTAQIVGGLILIVGVALAESARVTSSRPTPEDTPRATPPAAPAGR